MKKEKPLFILLIQNSGKFGTANCYNVVLETEDFEEAKLYKEIS